MNYKYDVAILGGTFDHFHIGHKKLIDAAFENSGKVIIGITTKDLHENKYGAHMIEDFKLRKTSVLSYLSERRYLEKAELVPIDNIYGNSITEKNIDAIFVTVDTQKNAEKINEERVKNGLNRLSIEIVPLVIDDDGDTVSSERIRRGEIDRHGRTYFNLFTAKKRYKLPEEMREDLRKPIGKVFKNIKDIIKLLDEKDMVIAIGDVASMNLKASGRSADINIFDFLIQREEISDREKKSLKNISNDIHEVGNEAGIIERRAVGVIRKEIGFFLSSGEKQSILVHGEDDLLTIPAILLSSLGTVVIYGQPGIGAVMVRVTEKKKMEIEKLFNRFL